LDSRESNVNECSEQMKNYTLAGDFGFIGALICEWKALPLFNGIVV